MSLFKLAYIIIFLLTAIPVLGYVRYLHDDKENGSGAFIVFLMVVVTGFALWKGPY